MVSRHLDQQAVAVVRYEGVPYTRNFRTSIVTAGLAGGRALDSATRAAMNKVAVVKKLNRFRTRTSEEYIFGGFGYGLGRDRPS